MAIGRSLREYGAQAGAVSRNVGMTLAEMEMQKGGARARGSLQRGQAFAAIPQAIAGAAGGYLKERQEAPMRELEKRRAQAQIGQAETQTEANRMTLEEKKQARAEIELLKEAGKKAHTDKKLVSDVLSEMGLYKQAADERLREATLAKTKMETDKTQWGMEESKRNQAELAIEGYLNLPEEDREGGWPTLRNRLSILGPEERDSLAPVERIPGADEVLELYHISSLSNSDLLSKSEKELKIIADKLNIGKTAFESLQKSLAGARPEKVPGILSFADKQGIIPKEQLAQIPTDPVEAIAWGKGMGAEKAATAGTGRTIIKVGADGKPHDFQFTPETGEYDVDLGVHYEKPEKPSTAGTAEERYKARAAARLGKTLEQLTQAEDDLLTANYKIAQKGGLEPDLPDDFTPPAEEDTLWNRLGWTRTSILSIPAKGFATVTGLWPSLTEDIQAFDSSMGLMRRALAENPRFPIAEMQRIEKEVNIRPDWYTAPGAVRAKMREVDKYLDSVEKRRRIAKDDGAVLAIQQFRRAMGVPGSNVGRDIIEVEMPDGSIKKFDQSGNPVK